MQKTNISKEWIFQYGEPSNIPMLPAKTEIIDLPHDFVISRDVSKNAKGGAETGFFEGCKGSYTKYLDFSAEDLKKHHELYFDGCAGNTRVMVNGHVVGHHNYAYTPFSVNLDRVKKEGKNRITVTANSSNEPNSRWYLGGGLYREVYLLSSEKVYIPADGLFVSTSDLREDNALLRIRTEICNHTEETVTCMLDLNVHEKKNSFCLDTKGQEGRVAGTECCTVVIEPMSGIIVQKNIIIENPHIWDVNCPELYGVTATLKRLPEIHAFAKENRDVNRQDNVEILDVASTTCGIRTITTDAVYGLRLNGRTIKLKGGCIHHDNGLLGAAAYRDAEYRKVYLHKKAGFNALRFAHNPMSSHLLDACDEIGILVFDEAFDTWNMNKDSFDFSQHFSDEWEKELKAFIARDRSHPSVFMWSIGNEIPEMGGLSDGYRTSRMLTKKTRELDDTRPVGGALCSFFRGLDDEDNDEYWKDVTSNMEELKKNGAVNLDCSFGRAIWPYYTAPFVSDWDVVGYNYLRYQYEPTHELFPGRVMVCSESKPREIAEYWKDVKRLPYLIGDFEWTSMDYIGEAGIAQRAYVDEEDVAETRQKMTFARYPMRLAGAGDFDICGFEKPQLYYRKAVLGDKVTYIAIHNPHNRGKSEVLGRYAFSDEKHSYNWDVPEQTILQVDVFSDAEEVELYVNQKSYGKKPAGETHDYRATFEVAYELGELLAISFDRNGKEISRDILKSATEAVGFKLFQDEAMDYIRIHSGNGDLSGLYYGVISKVDKEGNPIELGNEKIKVDVKNGRLLALGTGRCETEENYVSDITELEDGRAMVIVERTGTVMPEVIVETV